MSELKASVIEKQGLRNNILKLTPRISTEIAKFLQSEKIHELAQALGSPLNILFPEALDKNVAQFQAMLDEHRLRGRIYFAHKANRSDTIPRYLSTTTTFIDVSSINELRHALASGYEASRIQATGPKNAEFLYLCLQHNILLSIDSISELEQIAQLKSARDAKMTDVKPIKILLRISGFKNRQQKHQGKASRFGIKYDDITKAFDVLSEQRRLIHLKGFAFHLDTVSPLEKASAVESCLTLFEQALERDFEPTVLNIGGGFKVSYLEHAHEWHEYNSAMREAALGARETLTWQSNTFGLVPDKGSLRGSFNSYSFYDSTVGAAFLNEIISHQIDSLDGASIASFLRMNGIELWVEPGRALLDEVGITVARVNSVRESSQGDILVCLNMKRQDICFIDQEIFMDPIILYRDQVIDTETADYPVYFAGNLCLESDLITRHLTNLKKLPAQGDLVAFINTAGYFMDFSASEAIMQPIARKIAVFEKDNNNFGWSLDENFYPWLIQAEETI